MLSSRRRILLVYAVPYSGHAQAACALRASFEAMGAEVQEYHFLQQFKYTGSAIVRFYKWLLTYLPSVWGHVHDNPEYEGMAKVVISAMQEWDIAGLLKRVNSWQPDAIVAIQAFPLRLLAEAKQQGKITSPLFVVTTDFWAHRYWAHPAVDHYFVSSEQAKRDLIKRKIKSKDIVWTGIPLRPEFMGMPHPLPSASSAREVLQWPAKTPTVLCLGGSYGFIPFKELIQIIELATGQLQKVRWVIVFGNNKIGLQEAHKRLKTSPARDRVQVLGFRDDIEVLMRASDVCLTKAGGLSSSEAMVCRLPLVFYRPLPGQEQKNVSYLVKAGAAVSATTSKQAFKQIERLLTSSELRARMKKAQQRLARPHASNTITQTILQDLSSHL